MEKEEILQILERGHKIVEKHGFKMIVGLDKFDKMAVILHNSMLKLSPSFQFDTISVDDAGVEYANQIYGIIRKIIAIPSIECAGWFDVTYQGKPHAANIYVIKDSVDYYYQLTKQAQIEDIFIFCIYKILNGQFAIRMFKYKR